MTFLILLLHLLQRTNIYWLSENFEIYELADETFFF